MGDMDKMRAALLLALPLLENAAQPYSNYGMAGAVQNPHDFSPDPDCCTDEEIAAHKASIEAWDRGELVTNEDRGCKVSGTGAVVCMSGWYLHRSR